MRDLHARMLAALMAGEGLRGIAELAAEEAGGPVAIVLPTRGLADASSAEVPLVELSGYAAELLGGEAPEAPDDVEVSQTVSRRRGGDRLRARPAAVAKRTSRLAVDREEVVRTTALATLAEVAVTEARDEVADRVRAA